MGLMTGWRMVTAAGALVLMALGGAAQDAPHVSDYIRERQEGMADMERALALIEAMAAGQAPIDSAVAARRAADLTTWAGGLAEAFGDTPASRYGAQSRARQAVWTEPGGFLAGWSALESDGRRLIDASRRGDRPAMAAAAGQTRATCNACHQVYLDPAPPATP